MADPLSVAASCIGVIGAAGSTAKAILTFIKECREARSDLTNISRELADLQITLEILKDDGEGDALPTPLRLQIVSMVNSCGSVISDIDSVLKRHRGRSGALRWATDGKREVEGLRRGLETYRESLSLTVEAVTLSLAKSIKCDTEAIRGQTSAIPGIKYDTERILDGIEELRISMIPTEEQAWSKSPLLDDYLDGLTSYAETVCEEVIWESDTEKEEEEDHVAVEITAANEAKQNNNEGRNGGEDMDQTTQSDCGDGSQTKAKEEDMKHEERKETTLEAKSDSSDGEDRSQTASAEEDRESEERTKESSAIEGRKKTRSHRRQTKHGEGVRMMFRRLFDRCNGCGYQPDLSVQPEGRRPMITIRGSSTACAECIRCAFAASIASSGNMASNRPRWDAWSWLLASHAQTILDRASQVQYNRKYRRVSFECPIKDCGRTHEITADATRRHKLHYKHRSVCSWCFKKWHSQSNPVCQKDGEAQQLFDLTTKTSKN